MAPTIAKAIKKYNQLDAKINTNTLDNVAILIPAKSASKFGDKFLLLNTLRK